MMSTKINYALYARKSTEEQDRQVQSIDAQVRELRAIAKKNNLNITFTFEESKSAKTPNNRPKFSQMIKLVEQGKIQGILTWQINRLSRNPTESGLLQQLLQDNKIQRIQTYDRVYEPEDNAVVFSVESSISNQFIIDLRKNVKRGIREKARNGGISGPAPEGYINNRADKSVEIDPERFTHIKRCFEYYLTGDYTVKELKKMLDDWGYLTVKRKKVGGKPMPMNNLYGILTNPRYAGLVPDPYEDGVYHKANFPAMISVEQFDEVQRLLGRKGRTRHITKQAFELRGLLKCGECGCSITAERHKKKLKDGGVNIHVYYHCTKKRGNCSQGGVTEAELFTQLETLLNEYEINPQLYEWGLKAIKELAKDEVKQRDEIQQLQYASINEIQKKLDRLTELVTNGDMDGPTYKMQTESLKKELESRQDEQAETARRAKNWYEIIGSTLEKLDQASDKFRVGDFPIRRNILLAIGYNPLLIDKTVTITPNNWLIPIKKELPQLKQQLDQVRTAPQQIRNDLESSIFSSWYPGLELNQRP